MFNHFLNDAFEHWLARSARARYPSDIPDVLKSIKPLKKYYAIRYITTDDNYDSTLTDVIAPQPKPKPKPQKEGLKPPTKRAEAQQRRQRERNRQQRLARNEEEDFSNEISRMFNDTDDEAHSQPSDFTGPPEPSLPSPAFTATPTLHGPQRFDPPAEPEVRTVLSGPVAVLPRGNNAEDVWFFFEKAEDGDPAQSTLCKLCSNYRMKCISNPKLTILGPKVGVYAPKTSTGTLRKHLINLHQDEFVNACQKYGWQPRSVELQKLMGRTKAGAHRIPFTKDKFRKLLVEWMVGFDESINLVEYPPFRNFILFLRDTLEDKDIPHRTTIRRLISTIHVQYFDKLKSELQGSEGMIALTIDGWDDKEMRAYLGVTAHFMRRTNKASSQGKLVLKSALIAFLPTPGRHTGQVLAKALLKITDRAGITGKVRSISTDGAANMIAMAQDYEHLLLAQDMAFDALHSQFICFPHILHLAVNAMVDALTASKARQNPTAKFCSDFEEPAYLLTQDLDDALKRDPIAIAREIINLIRMSQIRRNEFTTLIGYGNGTEKWKAKTNGQESVVQLPKVIPIRDMPTRWGSTYLSITRMRLLRQPLEVYIARRPDIFKHTKLTESEWTVLEHIGDILERPYILQEMMSRESTPMLACSLPAYESVLASLKEAANQQKYSYMKHAIQAGIDNMQKNYNERVFSKLFILAIAIHPSMRMRWFERKWSKSGVTFAREVIFEELYKYQTKMTPPTPSVPSSHHQSPQKDIRFKLYGDFLDEPNSISSRQASACPIKEEFERYFGPNVLDTYPNPENVDIIEWWDRNSDRYPTLFRIALDILPVQASSVAAERAFSSAAETDTLKRNRIKPALMEELQLLKYAINTDRFNFTRHWHCTEDTVEEENEYQDDVEGWKLDEEVDSGLECFSDSNGSWEDDSTDFTSP